jgi:hypothetical protein
LGGACILAEVVKKAIIFFKKKGISFKNAHLILHLEEFQLFEII